MKIQRARHFRHGRIEIIPMIDVMFFLLVTFMLASLSMQSLNSITVNLPKGDAESLEHREPITLSVTHDNHIFIDKTPTTLDQLAFALKPLLKSNDLGVVVNADSDAPEGTVVQAMIQARRAGVEHFLIAVKRAQ
jgi:biopolymer transport protein ExbD